MKNKKLKVKKKMNKNNKMTKNKRYNLLMKLLR